MLRDGTRWRVDKQKGNEMISNYNTIWDLMSLDESLQKAATLSATLFKLMNITCVDLYAERHFSLRLEKPALRQV